MEEESGKVKINLTILDEKDFDRDESPVEKPKRRTMNKPSGRPKKKKEKEPVMEEDEDLIHVSDSPYVWSGEVKEFEDQSEEEEESKEGDLSWIWYVAPLALMVIKALTAK